MCKTNMLTFEQTKDLYDFLRGKSRITHNGIKKVSAEYHAPLIKSITLKDYGIDTIESHLPKLTDEQAFLVLYILQEIYHMIPDTFEICNACKELYDSDIEGTIVDDYYYCDDCARLVEHDDSEKE